MKPHWARASPIGSAQLAVAARRRQRQEAAGEAGRGVSGAVVLHKTFSCFVRLALPRKQPGKSVQSATNLRSAGQASTVEILYCRRAPTAV